MLMEVNGQPLIQPPVPENCLTRFRNSRCGQVTEFMGTLALSYGAASVSLLIPYQSVGGACFAATALLTLKWISSGRWKPTLKQAISGTAISTVCWLGAIQCCKRVPSMWPMWGAAGVSLTMGINHIFENCREAVGAMV